MLYRDWLKRKEKKPTELLINEINLYSDPTQTEMGLKITCNTT